MKSILHPCPCLGFFLRFIGVLLFMVILGNPNYLSAQDRMVVGWVEKVMICPGNLVLHAKLDTGARHSSLNAQNMKLFKRQGKAWVRFDVVNRSGQRETFEKPVVRTAKIKDHIRPADRRPVIQLGICLGDYYKEIEVNLTDRSEFKYQLLIGRSFMAEHFWVDPSTKYMRQLPSAIGCENQSF